MAFRKNRLNTGVSVSFPGETSYYGQHKRSCITSTSQSGVGLPINDILGPHAELRSYKNNESAVSMTTGLLQMGGAQITDVLDVARCPLTANN